MKSTIQFEFTDGILSLALLLNKKIRQPTANELLQVKDMVDALIENLPKEEKESALSVQQARMDTFLGNLTKISTTPFTCVQHKRSEKEGYIYLVRDKITNYHKIGYSVEPKVRETTLQSQKPDLEMIWTKKGINYDETILHRKFKSKRVRGEWFDLTKEDIELICK